MTGTDDGGVSGRKRIGRGDARSDDDALRDRGQTTLDFTIGMTVFLIVLIAVLMFIPGTLSPFTQGSQDDIVSVNRIADGLSEGLLGDPATPHVLNTTCTVAFFDDRDESYCRYSGSSLNERVGLVPRHRVNVTVQTNLTTDPGEELVCWDAANDELVASSDPACDASDTAFTIGESPEYATDTVTARRVVTIDGNDTTMIVEVW